MARRAERRQELTLEAAANLISIMAKFPRILYVERGGEIWVHDSYGSGGHVENPGRICVYRDVDERRIAIDAGDAELAIGLRYRAIGNPYDVRSDGFKVGFYGSGKDPYAVLQFRRGKDSRLYVPE